MVRLHQVAVCACLAACGRFEFERRVQQDAEAPADEGMPIASRCGTLTGELFCEDFEGEAKLPTVEATPPGFAIADDERTFRGKRSLHARTTGAPLEAAWVLGAALPNLVSGDFYARWYLYVPSGTTTLEMASVHVIDAMPPFRGVIVGITGGKMELVSSEGGEFVVSSVEMPRDRWACVQLHVLISQTAGVVESWLDGVPTGQLTGIDTLPAVSYRNVHAGVFATGTTNEPQELFTDEVAVATSPISCD